MSKRSSWVAALIVTAVLGTGCGASGAWEVASPAARRAPANRVREALRARVSVAADGEVAEAGVTADDAVRYEPQSESISVAAMEPSSSGSGGGPPPPSPWDAASESAVSPADAIQSRLEAEVRRDARPRYAQNDADGEPATATDATARQLLIYEAHLGLAVHHVVETQDRVEAMARERGGFLHSRTDDTIVVRVPADAFQPFLDALQELGDVVTRRIQVRDVTEEFRDVQQRIHTLELMRARVEQLLQRAQDVEAALAVQQHLERITVELEQLQGRLRFLSDRVAYSTITLHFAARSAASAPTFQLPFRWLRSLGLDTLLSL